MEGNEKQAANSCHWGNKFAFQWQNLRFFGAGSFRGLSTTGIDVFIDCGANIQQDTDIQQGRIILIDWADGSVPDMTEEYWRNILQELEKIRSSLDKDKLNILVCCVGGHGRTGTALAILAALTGVAPEDPADFIHERYCYRAIETRSQCSYIKKIAGLSTGDDTSPAGFDSSCESSLR